MGQFREHGVMLYLDRELYRAFIKLQADKDLGRSYAGLLPFTEGLHKLGYITEEVYEAHKKKYSEPLVAEKPKALTKEQQRKLGEVAQLNNTLRQVAEQWHDHPDEKWRQLWIDKAGAHPELPNSRLIFALAEGKGV